MLDKNSAFRSPWVISWIVLFVILISSMVYRIVIGIQTHPGLVTADYYERGKDYEANMLKKQAHQLVWSLKIEGPRQLPQNEAKRFSFSFKNRAGEFMSADKVTFYAYRPSDEKQDFSVPMSEVTTGYYQADIAFPLKGAWDILVSVMKDNEEYNEDYFVSVRPK